MAWASARKPALAALKAPKLGRPRNDALAPVKISVPAPAGNMRRTASRPNKNPPKQPMRQLRSK
ncbi:hypothetical protein D3C83_196480 [compost metagenome]